MTSDCRKTGRFNSQYVPVKCTQSESEKENKTMYTQRGKKYIYSVDQANEFIQRGYKCIETGFNAKQRKYFWVFNYEEVQDYYETSERYK